MAVPDGYTVVEIGKTYTDVDYWINTSGGIEQTPTADTDTVVWYNNETEIFKKEEYEPDRGKATLKYVPASLTIFDGLHDGWVISETNGINANGKIVVNGVVVDKISITHIEAWSASDDDTLDTYDDTWLYVKEPTQPATHEMTITLGEGVESLEMNFTEPDLPDLPKVNLRVYTYGDVTTGDYGITVSENDNVIFEESGTYDAIDTTLEVTQNSTITVELSGCPWYFTIYKDGNAVTSAGMDGQTYSFIITEDTTISVWCNYD